MDTADALSGARRLAASEMGAAIAHQLVEPLTALLLYMQQLKSIGQAAPGAEAGPLLGLVDGALAQTERVCAIVERIGKTFETPGDCEAAVTVGREAIETLALINPAAAQTEAPPARDFDHRLTPREREVLKLIAEGATNKEGAQRLQISPRTFESHRAQIMRKLGARNAADLLHKVLVERR